MKKFLRELIIHEIESNGGAISFERFMEMALYTPNLGYYMRNVPVIGQKGDFFTASHAGNIFGLLLSRHIIKIWQEMGEPNDFHIIEIGPGMGYLAYDVLTALASHSTIFQSLSYHLVEMNPHFASIQKARLSTLHPRIFWWSDISAMPSLCGVCICNEIIDAFPVRLFEVKQGRIMEIYVSLNPEGNFLEILRPAEEDLINYLEFFAPWVKHFDDYRSEANLSARTWLKNLKKILDSGKILIIDYGHTSEEYYDPSRNRGTLLCYFKHQVNDCPYINIGEQDITAHVNFTAIEEWAKEAGFSVEEYTTQHRYLLSLADEQLLEKLYSENPASMAQFKTLILPQGMGESHKVMILSTF
ncbi:MAG: SAM-dependent methyltransferase [Thermodesulforhabdaceae bacterium]